MANEWEMGLYIGRQRVWGIQVQGKINVQQMMATQREIIGGQRVFDPPGFDSVSGLPSWLRGFS